MSEKKPSYCEKLKDDIIIEPTKDNNWFFNFLVTLLNESSNKLIEKKQSHLKKILVNSIDGKSIDGTNINFIGAMLKNININKFVGEMNKTMNISYTLYKYLLENKLEYYFLFPYYIKYLGFTCITFEYIKEKIYGGVYKYLTKYNNNEYYINDILMNKSNGLKYDQRENNNPEYLIINLWNNDDNFLNNYDITEYFKEYEINSTKYENFSKPVIDKETKIPEEVIEYNGYKYILNSQLLTNYNTTQYKKPQHTISVIKCDNKHYAFTNSYYKKNPENLIKKVMSYNPLNNEYEPCTKLVELNKPTKKMILHVNSCTLENKEIKEIDEKKNYCFSIKKGKRVLIYIKGDKIKEEKKEEKVEEKEKEEEKKKKLDEEDAKKKKPEKPETPEQKAEREGKEKMCNDIYGYLKKIKTNQDKDKLLDKIKEKEEIIAQQLKELGENEKKYEPKKAELEKLKIDIEKIQRDNAEILTKLIDDLKKELPKKKVQYA